MIDGQPFVASHSFAITAAEIGLLLGGRSLPRPVAIRLVLLGQHYRTDWDYTPQLLTAAEARLAQWREALSVNAAPSSDDTVAAIRAALANDLDAPAALAAVDAWAQRTLTDGGDEPSAPGVLARALDALLGVRV